MEFTVSTLLNAKPESIFKAWLSSTEQTAMTGGEANVSDQANTTFTAWDNYISGVNLILEPYKRIVQLWRTTEFEAGESDSQIEILLTEKESKTIHTKIHANLPDSKDSERYKKGWEDHYFAPMRTYFEK